MATKRITDVDFIESLDSNESFFVNQNNTIKQVNKSNITFGIANGGTGAVTAEEARKNLGAISLYNEIIELSVEAWTNNSQIVNVGNVTNNNMIIVSPDYLEDNYLAYIEYGVRCTAQAEGILTFSCNEVPNKALTVNVAVFS